MYRVYYTERCQDVTGRYEHVLGFERFDTLPEADRRAMKLMRLTRQMTTIVSEETGKTCGKWMVGFPTERSL